MHIKKINCILIKEYKSIKQLTAIFKSIELYSVEYTPSVVCFRIIYNLMECCSLLHFLIKADLLCTRDIIQL